MTVFMSRGWRRAVTVVGLSLAPCLARAAEDLGAAPQGAPSEDDGTAVAVPAAAARIEDLRHVLGQAWEPSTGAGIWQVRALVGLSAADPLAHVLADRDREQRAEIAALRARLDDLERRGAESAAAVERRVASARR